MNEAASKKALVAKGPTNYHGKQQPPDRPGFGTLGRRMTVRANFFPIKFPRQMSVYHYDVTIEPAKMPKSICKKVLVWALSKAAISGFGYTI